MTAFSPRQLFQVTIALACVLGLIGSIILAGIFHDMTVFYTAGSSVFGALFFSWMCDVWSANPEQPDETGDDIIRKIKTEKAGNEWITRKSEELARKLGEVLTNSIPGVSTMTVGAYQALQTRLAEFIQTCLLEGEDKKDEKVDPAAIKPA
jgi:hypothetical protein